MKRSRRSWEIGSHRLARNEGLASSIHQKPAGDGINVRAATDQRFVYHLFLGVRLGHKALS